jgi:tRNA A37 threonylcarbamoyladenosine dehydratase
VDIEDRFSRSKDLFKENFVKLQNAKILIIGVGGVGGYALDGLYRSGITDISIIDFDRFDITNQNRQIGSQYVGKKKVEALSMLYEGIKPLHVKVTKEWVESFDFEPYDIVIDAIDDMSAKVALAHKTYHKLISSAGGAKRLDPTKIESSSIWKTHSDALAKKFRYELKKSDFGGDFEVVFSSEPPICKDLGSFVGVTGSFGFTLASLAIRRLIYG